MGDGNYQTTLEASGLGVVTATVVDAWGQATTASATIANMPPVINSVSMEYAICEITFIGTLSDEDPASVTIQSTGYAADSTMIDDDGEFYVFAPPGHSGTYVITFVATDAWGVSSAPYEFYFDI